jgi:hypothetical protein
MDLDNLAMFAVDQVDFDIPDDAAGVKMWAGTDHPIVNELLCQAIQNHVEPFRAQELGIATAGARGVFFLLQRGDFEDKELLSRISAALEEQARRVANLQGFTLQAIPVPERMPSFLYYALQNGIAVSRHPEQFAGGVSDDDGEEEEM